jgi:predicted nuclease of restriction endonuclease-like (RecB) superfamily
LQQPAAKLSGLPEDYAEFLTGLKTEIATARVRAALSVNRELVLLYWNIGKQIIEQQKRHNWGAKIIEQLAIDLHHEFPEIRGFSVRNLKYMRSLAETHPDVQIVQQAVAQIPWGHNVRILDLVSDSDEREWYIRKTIENGWSRNVLVLQIESDLYHRQGKATTNFKHTLPQPQSDLAEQILKDPYNFEFLALSDEAQERDVHRKLLVYLRKFLIELGVGFAFVGSEYHLEVDGNDYYLDLLFYHYRLRSFVIIELKVGEFKPEHAGKMNFYLSAVDDLLRGESDHPSIGLILCKSKSKIVVEYALRDTKKPVGVSSFKLTSSLPKKWKDSLPTVEDIEEKLRNK